MAELDQMIERTNHDARIDWTTPALDDLRSIDDWLTAEADPEWATADIGRHPVPGQVSREFSARGTPRIAATTVSCACSIRPISFDIA